MNNCCKKIKVDIRSKFAVELNFFDQNGNALDPNVLQFKLIYHDSRNGSYEVSNIDGVRTHNFIKDNHLFAKFENHGLRAGPLTREVYIRQEITPDEGEGFSGNEMLQIINDNSIVELVDRELNYPPDKCPVMDGYCFIGVERFQFPCVEYKGLLPSECCIVANDFINNKHEVADAINDMGGSASENDSMKELADKIRELLPAQPIFQTSGNLNPRWTDLQAVIALHYREDRKYCWAFSFIGDNPTIQLTGGDYYICSDGYETNQSGTHTFGANLDESKTDNWVIIYTQTPTFVFPSDIGLIGTAFYNTSPLLVTFQGTTVVFISQAGSIENTNFDIPANFLQGTGISYFIIPDGVTDVLIGEYAFSGCTYFIDFIASNLNSIIINKYAFNSTKVSSEFKAVNITLNENSFYGVRSSKATIKASGNLVMNANIFTSSLIDELFIGNPTQATFAYNFTVGYTGRMITLEDNWNLSLNIAYASNQTALSMYQNVQALADRTGKTARTLTFGATKLASLLAAHPDAATIASNKNWNLG